MEIRKFLGSDFCFPRSRALHLWVFVASVLAILGCSAEPREPDGNDVDASAVSAAAGSTAEMQSPSSTISDEEVVRRYSRIWAENERGIFQNKWMGIPTLQNPLDLWITQEILYEVKPDFVIEAGSYRGGSAIIWASLLEQINPEARVITIDVNPVGKAALQNTVFRRTVDFLRGGSTDPETVSEVFRRVGDKSVVVILDSLHTKEHVLAELRAYAPLVPIGSYFIVQDTGVGLVVDRPKLTTAAAGVHEFMKDNDEFEYDRSRERLMLTNCPDGFLKRVR